MCIRDRYGVGSGAARAGVGAGPGGAFAALGNGGGGGHGFGYSGCGNGGHNSGGYGCGYDDGAHAPPPPPFPPDEPLAIILSRQTSPVWSQRAACLAHVASLVGSEREVELLHPTAASQVVSAVLTHLTDIHYRVVLSALECVTAGAHLLAPALEQPLERLLPRLLARLSDPKLSLIHI